MTDDVTLTEDEWEVVRESLGWDWTEAPGVPSVADAMAETTAAVEQIIAAREAGLRAELERLQRWRAEALPVLDGLQDLGRALGIPLGERITGPQATEAAEALVAEVERLRDEVAGHRLMDWPREIAHVKVQRDRLAAQVEAVRRVADGWRHDGPDGEVQILVTRILALLDQDGGQ